MTPFTESVIEQATLDCLKEIGNKTTFDHKVADNYVGPTLASPRDALLPKLMRGEVRVAVHE